MKIDQQYISPDASQVRQAGQTPTKERTSGKNSTDGASAHPVDTVDLSGAASARDLVSRAVTAALSEPDTRSQAVERAKALHASGELGRDHEALANAIIDHLIEQS
jgi:anti-sigma28 factor (negative regulator of flagellin synthesis)